MNTFLLLLAAHFLGDIVFTSYRLAVLKRNSELLPQALAVGCHSGIHAFFAGLILLAYGGLWARAALLVFAVHFFIDFIRCLVDMRLFGPGRIYIKRSELIAWIKGESKEPDKMSLKNIWPWFLITLMDQSAHLATLYGVSLAL